MDNQPLWSDDRIRDELRKNTMVVQDFRVMQKMRDEYEKELALYRKLIDELKSNTP